MEEGDGRDRVEEVVQDGEICQRLQGVEDEALEVVLVVQVDPVHQDWTRVMDGHCIRLHAVLS